MFFKRLKPMIVKEFLQMLRDPRMRMVVFAMPVIQVTVLAFALTTDVRNIRTAVIDSDNTPISRALVDDFTAGGYFEVTALLRSEAPVNALLDTGTVQAVLHIPIDFGADVLAGRPVRVQLLADGTMSNDTSITFNYASQIINGYNQQLIKQRAAAAGISPGTVVVEPRAWYNPNLESKYYFVPGLIVLMLLLISLLLASIAIVREKEIGTIEQVMVTPIRRLEFILGKTLPFLITGYITMSLMFIMAFIIFGIRIQGSILLLYAFAGIYLMGNLGLAILVSVISHTQQQALLTAFFILMPAVLLSGYLFPIRNMPQAVQILTLANPMRWALQIVHGIVVRGVGITTLWPAACAQTALAASFVGLAVVRFKKTLK
jgi:ABC-2 type transport system permease protein